MRVLRVAADLQTRVRVLSSQHAADVRGTTRVHSVLLLRRSPGDHQESKHI